MQWQRKLYELEEIPPPHCWEEVRSSIEKEPLRLGLSLFEMETEPPAAAWEKIQEGLQVPAEILVSKPARIVFRRPTLSFAAALAGFGVLAAILVYVFSRNNENLHVRDLAAGLTYPDSQQIPARDPGKNTTPDGSTRNLPDMGSPATAANSPGPTKNGLAASAGAALGSRKSPASSPTSYGNKIVGKGNSKVKKPVIRYSDGNYIQVVEPDGDVTRVSYKLADMVRSVLNPSSPQSRADQQRWNHTLEAWKTKMAQSTYIPSGSNFFDIADMIRFLNEEGK
jgi:hypothetical protein